MESEETTLYPSYLRDAFYPGKTYGILSYNRRSKCWMIRGEENVIELALRLFPEASSKKRTEVRFAAHRRIIGDLNWLMLRYPLDIKETDRERYELALEEAREFARAKERLRNSELSAEPPENTFVGTLMPFQKEGLAFLLGTDRALLADEMGLGKTVQALSYVASVQAYPILLVVPTHLMRNWEQECRRFLRVEGELKIHTIKGLKPYKLPEAHIYIIHYLLLRGWRSKLPDMGFKTVIFDEIQELRHAGTEKYSVSSLLSSAADRVIGLSGTPIYNYGGEIWNVINILDFQFLGSFEAFTRAWCSGYGNMVVTHPDKLGDYLRNEGIMLRRTKDQVLPQLPPKRRLVQEIDWDDALYRKMLTGAIEKFGLLENAENESQRTIIEDSICQDERRATGCAKAPYVGAFVRTLLDGDEKVLLFAHHHDVMDIYKKEFAACHPVFVTGRETATEKALAVEKFMCGRTNLCIVSLRAASGLNLQRATCVVFGELDWSPAVHSQAEDRAHRIGQEDSVLCYYLVSPKGSDKEMQQALGLKVSQFVSLMGDAVPDEETEWARQSSAREHIHALVERLYRSEKEGR